MDETQDRWEKEIQEDTRRERAAQERENERIVRDNELSEAVKMLEEYNNSVPNRTEDIVGDAATLQDAIKAIREAASSKSPVRLPKAILDLGAIAINPGSAIDYGTGQYIDKGLETVTALVGPIEKSKNETWERVFEMVKAAKKMHTKTAKQFQRQLMGDDFRSSLTRFLGEVEQQHGAEAAAEVSRSLLEDSVEMLRDLERLDGLILEATSGR